MMWCNVPIRTERIFATYRINRWKDRVFRVSLQLSFAESNHFRFTHYIYVLQEHVFQLYIYVYRETWNILIGFQTIWIFWTRSIYTIANFHAGHLPINLFIVEIINNGGRTSEIAAARWRNYFVRLFFSYIFFFFLFKRITLDKNNAFVVALNSFFRYPVRA